MWASLALLVSAGCRSDSSPRAVLSAAFEGKRPIEQRLSGVPFGTWNDDDPMPPAQSDQNIALALTTLERELGSTPSPPDLKWAAAGRLLVGDPATAVQWLGRAVEQAPTDADLLCDLSAAYQIRAARTKDSGDVARAIDAARRGIARQPQHAACAFNLALSFRQAGLAAMADDAFSRAAALEAGAWSDEAGARVRSGDASDNRESLTRQLEPAVSRGNMSDILTQLPQHIDIVQELLERSVLTAWADAIRAGDRDAVTRLKARAHAIADAIKASNGDRHASDLVSFFDRCTRPCAVAWTSHVAAMGAWYDERFADARTANAVAEAEFGSAPSAVNASRILLRVTLARIDGRNAEARSWVPALREFYARVDYRMVTGRLTWQAALLESERGNFGGAVALYRVAADWLGRARDREGSAMVDSLLAEKYQELHDFDRAWRYAMSAISRLNASREFRQRAILAATAMLASANGLDEAAMAFREPLIDRARRSKTAVYLARLLSEDATSLMRVGRTDAARGRIQEAAENLARIDDPATAALSRALVQTVQGRVLSHQSPREAAASFAEAAAIYRARGNFFATPVLELERGRVLLKAGDADAAQRAFEAGIAAAEHERRSSQSDAERVGLLSARWDLYAALIDLQIRLKNETAAVGLLDSARAANLVESVGTRAKADPLTLPDGTVALEYAVLPSGVHLWVTAGRDRRRFAVPMAPDALETGVSDYLDAVRKRRPPAELNRLSSLLFEALCGPVRDRLSGAQRLVIVPDGPLHALPFAALYDRASSSVLVERLAITVTPSLAFHRRVSIQPPVKHRLDVVAIGSATGRVSGERVLPNLPAAAREVGAVAGLYGRAHVLRAENATRQRFLEVAGLGRVLHFAGHALVEARDPNLSRLLVAPTPDDAVGAVFASDIAHQDLRGVRLVILSACDTAGGRVSRGEGVIGLARTFLKAGASSVIATLWPVDDQSALEIAIAVHQELVRGRSAADALRAAQAALRQNGRTDVVDWAASVVLGGDVTTSAPVMEEGLTR